MSANKINNVFYTGLIRQLFERHNGTYGIRRITAIIRAQGHIINHKRTERLMKEMGLKADRWNAKR